MSRSLEGESITETIKYYSTIPSLFMIPKTVHFCWFGGKSYSPILAECMETWKQHLSDYELKRWDETNSPLDANRYVREAFQCGQWAFVADYVRFHALAEEGGIYLDTDMRLCRPLNPLLKHGCFLGFEDSRRVNGAIIGAVPKHRLIVDCLNHYGRTAFEETHPAAVPQIITAILHSYGSLIPGKRQRIDDIELYPPEFFYPWPLDGHERDADFKKFVTSDSYAVHLWNKSWKSEFDCFREGRIAHGLSLVSEKLKRNPFRPLRYYWRLFRYSFRIPWFALRNAFNSMIFR